MDVNGQERTFTPQNQETPAAAGQSETQIGPSVIANGIPVVPKTQQKEVQQISVPAPEISVNVVPPQNEIRVELVKIPPSPRPCVDLEPAKGQD